MFSEDENRISQSEVHFRLFHLQNDDLEKLKVDFISFFVEQTKDYIWNNNGCVIELGKSFVHGQLDFGDLYDEEWILVKVLLEFTKKTKNVAARIFDADDEFMLVEAADELPDWLSPETAAFRLWMCAGECVIIPPDFVIKSEADAVHVMRTKEIKPLANIQRIIQKKVEAIRLAKMVHKANVTIPRRAAFILETQPHLISAAVGAFYCRDPIDLRGCRTMSDFPAATSVECQIVLNRCSMAQLLYQPFKPDKRSGFLPLPDKHDPKFQSVDVGVKIATGMQILLVAGRAAKKNKLNPVKGSEMERFVQKLKSVGYFGEHMEHSVAWTRLLENATNFYRQNDEHVQSNDSFRLQSARRISQLSDEFDQRHVILKSDAQTLPPEDSMDWLNVNESDFNGMLNRRYNWTKTDAPFKNQVDELEALTEKMKKFTQATSDFDGVVIDQTIEHVELDPAKFEAAINNILGGRQVKTDESDYLDSDDFDSDVDEDTNQYYDAMNHELSDTKVFGGLLKAEDDESTLDVDMNLVAGLMKSYESQMGLSGPAGNLMTSLGVDICDNED